MFVLVVAGIPQGYPFDAKHIIAPGRTEITLAEPGHYTIGYEYQTVLAGRTFNTPPSFPSLDLQLMRAGDGSQVPIDLVSGNSPYEGDNVKGEDIAEFSIDRAGKYVLVSQYGAGQEGPQVVLAVGRNADVVIGLEVFGVVAGIACMLAGAVMAIVLVILRARAQVEHGAVIWQPTGTPGDQWAQDYAGQVSDQGSASDSGQDGRSEASSGGSFDPGSSGSSDPGSSGSSDPGSSGSSDSGSSGSFDSGSSGSSDPGSSGSSG